MVRLPIPGSDDGTWGGLLNAYLQVSLASDGTLQSDVVDSTQLANGSVQNSKLASLAVTDDKIASGTISGAKLNATVQTSLGKADTAYQKPVGGIPGNDLTVAAQASLSAADTAYQKPGTGVPAGDMATAVQTSLGKADTAVQPADIVSGLGAGIYRASVSNADTASGGRNLTGFDSTLHADSGFMVNVGAGTITVLQAG